MNHKGILFLVVCLLLLLAAPFALAQSGSRFDLSWNTIDGGGATFSTEGSYSLGGTIGQPDAGLLFARGYSLGGGFWPESPVHIYLPVVMRSA